MKVIGSRKGISGIPAIAGIISSGKPMPSAPTRKAVIGRRWAKLVKPDGRSSAALGESGSVRLASATVLLSYRAGGFLERIAPPSRVCRRGG